MRWDYHDMGAWVAMTLMMVLFSGLILAAAASFVASVRRDGGNEPLSLSPEETLARRLASGEIRQEEYRALSDELRSRPRRGHRRPALFNLLAEMKGVDPRSTLLCGDEHAAAVWL